MAASIVAVGIPKPGASVQDLDLCITKVLSRGRPNANVDDFDVIHLAKRPLVHSKVFLKMHQERPDSSASEQLRRAVELHDGLCQSLSALAFYSRMLADDLQESESSHADQAERVAAMITAINHATRELSHSLHVSTDAKK